MTIWPGALRLATSTSVVVASWRIFSSSPPMSAAMAPSVVVQASSMKVPRRETRWRPSMKEKVPAAAWAVNSPSERPAVAAGWRFGRRSLRSVRPMMPWR